MENVGNDSPSQHRWQHTGEDLLRVTVVSFERDASYSLPVEWWLFFKVALLQQQGDDELFAKTARRTASKRDAFWGETVEFVVPPRNDTVRVQLVAWGRVQNLELGNVDITLHSLRTLLQELECKELPKSTFLFLTSPPFLPRQTHQNFGFPSIQRTGSSSVRCDSDWLFRGLKRAAQRTSVN